MDENRVVLKLNINVADNKNFKYFENILAEKILNSLYYLFIF